MADEKRDSVWTFVDVRSADLSKSLADIDTDKMKPDERVEITVPMFREGQFDHPYYGELNFDLNYLQGLKNNYERKVVPRAIAFDQDHRRFTGEAIGWLESAKNDEVVKIAQTDIQMSDGSKEQKNVLYGTLSLNRHGARMVKEGRYRYFSAEIKNDYTTRERVTVNGTNDTGIIKHGPTIVGGALTNNPFIPGLGGYQYSEGSVVGEYDETHNVSVKSQFDDDLGYGFGVYAYSIDEKPKEPNDAQPTVGSEPEIEPSEEFSGENKMEKLLAKLAELNSPQQKLDFLNDQAEQYSDDPAAAGTVQVLKLSIESQIASEQKFSEAARIAAQAQKEAKTLRDENVQLAVEARLAKEGAFSDQVELYCEKKLATGVTPAVVEVLKNVLLASPTASRAATFSFSEDEDAESVNLMGVIDRIFAAMPEEAFVSFDTSLAGTAPNETAGSEPGETVPDGQQHSDEEEEEDPNAVPANVQKYADNYNRGVLPDKSLWDVIDEEGRGFKDPETN